MERNGWWNCRRGAAWSSNVPPLWHWAFYNVGVSDTKDGFLKQSFAFNFHHWYIKESEGPFPWSSSVSTPTNDKVTKHVRETVSPLPSWMASLPPTLQSSPGLQTIALQAATMGCIEVKIPKVNLMAGRVLAHCIAVIETLFKMWDPMIFKLGYTHDPIWRWSNDLYGYCQSREKWSNMVILWISDEPFAPAMLEASLIEKYKGI